MYKITAQTLNDAYKPYDIVSDKDGNVGFVQEVSVNQCQPEPHQIQYAVNWLTGDCSKHAWFKHNELEKHCNLFIKIAESSCHPSGGNEYWVKKLMNI
jgi:hypothetical protein